MKNRTSTIFLTAIFLVTCLLGATRSAQAETFPIEGTGALGFQADFASFLGPTGEIEVEFYVKVGSGQLNFLSREDPGRALVRLTVGFVDQLGEEYRTENKEFILESPTGTSTSSASESPDDAHIIMARYPVTTRFKRVRIVLEDLRARRQGIMYVFTKERKSGTALGDVDLTFPLKGTLSLSDIQFAWAIAAGEGGAFPKSGLDVVPNPARSYGLRKPDLSTYMEVYDQTEFSSRADRVYYSVVSLVLDVDREIILSDTQRIVSSSDEWVHTTALDLSSVPGGGYWLRTEVSQEGGPGSAVREREFDVLWYDASWRKSDQDLLDEASLFLSKDEFAEFRGMAPGERERFLQDVWKDADPTPGTARNETRDEFYRRVAYANRHFSFFGKGMLSDRGRVYIRYGEPDLIEKQVVPTTGDEADLVVNELVGRENMDESLRQKLGGRDKKSYEIWIYNMRGVPLFEKSEQMMTQSLGMKFVFVDDAGVGNFMLEYSSDHSKYR